MEFRAVTPAACAPLRVDPTFLDKLRALPPIPKKIHVSWNDTKLLSRTDLDIVRRGVGALQRLNPDWKITLYDDAAVWAYIEAHVSKSDFARLRQVAGGTGSDVLYGIAGTPEEGLAYSKRFALIQTNSRRSLNLSNIREKHLDC